MKGIKFGSCYPWGLYGRHYEIYEENIIKATLDYGIYPNNINPRQGHYDFSVINRNARRARNSGFELRGHALFFPTSEPYWLRNGNFSQNEMEEIIEDRITTVMEKCARLGIREWVVVNEPYFPPYRPDPFYDAFGSYDYILYAFQIARQTDPDARLIYNDTDNHRPDGLTTNLTMKIIRRLKQDNLVDAVGLQLHLGDWVPLPTSESDINGIIETIQRYKKMGVDVVITEFDVNLTGVAGPQSERLKLQAKIYREVLRAALEAGVTDITFWGLDDSNSWIEFALNQKDGDPTLFDENFQPKPAYYAILSLLFSD